MLFKIALSVFFFNFQKYLLKYYQTPIFKRQDYRDYIIIINIKEILKDKFNIKKLIYFLH